MKDGERVGGRRKSPLVRTGSGDAGIESAAVAFRLSHVFTNPEEFDPERYAPGREEDKAQPFSHTTFGGGRHGCMGETFAYLQVPTEVVHSCTTGVVLGG